MYQIAILFSVPKNIIRYYMQDMFNAFSPKVTFILFGMNVENVTLF